MLYLTSTLKDDATNRVRADVEKWARVGDHKMAHFVNKMESGGGVSEGCKRVQKAETNQKGIETGGKIVESISSGVKGDFSRKKQKHFE